MLYFAFGVDVMTEITKDELLAGFLEYIVNDEFCPVEVFLKFWDINRVALSIPDDFELYMQNIIEGEEIEDALSKFVNICKFKLAQAEAQYQATCPECEKRLCIDTPIMCWNNGEKDEDSDEETVCSECYWECEWYKTDKNEDNQEEIEERVLFKNWIESN